jgi:hypothetical protein
MAEQPKSGNYKAATAAKCIAKAMECEQEAKRARDPSVKTAWLQMAKDWRTLAAQVEAGRW